MKISEVIESLSELERVYGDVEVVMLYRTDGHVPTTVNVMLDRVPYGVLIETEVGVESLLQ